MENGSTGTSMIQFVQAMNVKFGGGNVSKLLYEVSNYTLIRFKYRQYKFNIYNFLYFHIL